MDRKLLAPKLLTWARAVKRRVPTPHPILWLFTDASRGVDPLSAAARLPKHLCGVVFRHDSAPNRAAIGRALARICRARHLVLVVAGDIRLAHALRAGVHLRAGRWPGPQAANLRARRCITSSAHGLVDVHRARRAGAQAIFLSPVFATASHPGAAGLGAARWSAMVHQAHAARILALGGITGGTARALPRSCAGAGAIGALGG